MLSILEKYTLDRLYNSYSEYHINQTLNILHRILEQNSSCLLHNVKIALLKEKNHEDYLDISLTDLLIVYGNLQEEVSELSDSIEDYKVSMSKIKKKSEEMNTHEREIRKELDAMVQKLNKQQNLKKSISVPALPETPSGFDRFLADSNSFISWIFKFFVPNNSIKMSIEKCEAYDKTSLIIQNRKDEISTVDQKIKSLEKLENIQNNKLVKLKSQFLTLNDKNLKIIRKLRKLNNEIITVKPTAEHLLAGIKNLIQSSEDLKDIKLEDILKANQEEREGYSKELDDSECQSFSP